VSRNGTRCPPPLSSHVMVDGPVASFGCLSHNFKTRKKSVLLGLPLKRPCSYLPLSCVWGGGHGGRACNMPGREMGIAHRILICN
jgi:hypothetical protein